MKVYQAEHRVLAARSYRTFLGIITEATKDFRISCKTLGLKPPQAASKFVRYWGQYWDENGHAEGDASNCGRKVKLSTEDAEVLVADLMNWAGFGLKGPFTSLRQLRKASPRADAILRAAAAATSTVIKALRNIEPMLAYKKLTVKQRLTYKQRGERVRVAELHMHETDKALECVVWIDAKTMYMTIKTRCGWIRLDDEVPFETTRPASKKDPIKLRYYIGVCARAGGVFLAFYTGTTGMPADRDPGIVYLVSSPNVQLRLLVL
jgi:hypothetical protein